MLPHRPGLLPHRPRRHRRIASSFRAALAAAPAALPLAFALDVAVVAGAAAFATKATAVAVVLSGLVSLVSFVAALGARSGRAFLSSVLSLALACALADLPIHRGAAAVFAAMAGAAVLVFAEAGGAALDPMTSNKRIGHPGAAHVAWVGTVAVVGASAGLLALSLQSDISGLGVAALAVGALAAVCVMALTGVLATAAVTERGRR